MLNNKKRSSLSYFFIVGVLFILSSYLMANSGLTFKDVGGGAHYKDILIGDRAATMGGAFTAISDDASGVFYNPAGLVYIPYSTFSGSANTFHQTKIMYKNAIGKYDWKRDSLTVKPNFFSLVNKHNSDLVWGVSYVVPKAKAEDQHEAFLDYDGEGEDFFFNYHDEDKSTYLGPTVSYKLLESLSVGMSFYYFFRDRKYQANQFIRETGSGGALKHWRTQDRVVSIKGFLPIFGVMWTPADKVSLGASIRTHFINENNSKMAINSIDYQVTSNASVPVAAYIPNYQYPVEYPIHISVGGAYFASPELLISSDIDYYHIDDKDHKKIINLSFGLEYFFKSQQAIRLGFYTNNTNVPKPTINTTDNRSVDLIGFTAGYTLYGPTNYLTLGVVYSSGKGKAQVNTNGSITDYNRTDLSLIISAGFGF